MDFLGVLEHFTDIHSIEIVPRYLLEADWCVVDGVLGIADKFLIKAYMRMCPLRPRELSPAESLLAVLATTESVAAINARKRLCLSGAVDPAEELRIFTVILKSPLFKHCKSSFLWDHRRWLLVEFRLQTSLPQEWDVVQHAAEHHPKNYYAWGYLRWYVKASCADKRELEGLYPKLKQLCMRNLGDVSIWTFLHWLGAPDLQEFAEDVDREFPGHEAILACTRQFEQPYIGEQTSL